MSDGFFCDTQSDEAERLEEFFARFDTFIPGPSCMYLFDGTDAPEETLNGFELDIVSDLVAATWDLHTTRQSL